jgi:hypothetical protein
MIQYQDTRWIISDKSIVWCYWTVIGAPELHARCTQEPQMVPKEYHTTHTYFDRHLSVEITFQMVLSHWVCQLIFRSKYGSLSSDS